jgi:hypothetical protein
VVGFRAGKFIEGLSLGRDDRRGESWSSIWTSPMLTEQVIWDVLVTRLLFLGG